MVCSVNWCVWQLSDGRLTVTLTIDLESSRLYGLYFEGWLCVVYSCRRTQSSPDRDWTFRFHDSEVAMRATASKNGCSNVSRAKIFRSEKPSSSSTKAHLPSQQLMQRQGDLVSAFKYWLNKRHVRLGCKHPVVHPISASDSPSPRLGIPWVRSFTTQLSIHHSTVCSLLNYSFTGQLFIY